jgi:hypothetical protein
MIDVGDDGDVSHIVADGQLGCFCGNILDGLGGHGSHFRI